MGFMWPHMHIEIVRRSSTFAYHSNEPGVWGRCIQGFFQLGPVMTSHNLQGQCVARHQHNTYDRHDRLLSWQGWNLSAFYCLASIDTETLLSHVCQHVPAWYMLCCHVMHSSCYPNTAKRSIPSSGIRGKRQTWPVSRTIPPPCRSSTSAIMI